MRPDTLRKTMQNMQVVPFLVWRDGRVWWPEGKLLGVRRSKAGYASTVEQEYLPSLRQAWETLWRDGEASVDHVIMRNGVRLMVRMRMRREDPDEPDGVDRAVGVLRPLGLGQVSTTLPDTFPMVSTLCSQLAFYLFEAKQSSCLNREERLERAELLLRRMKTLGHRMEDVLLSQSVQPMFVRPLALNDLVRKTVRAFSPFADERALRLSAAQTDLNSPETTCAQCSEGAGTPSPSERMAEVDLRQTYRCIADMLVCSMQRMAAGSELRIRAEVCSDWLVLTAESDTPFLCEEELRYLRTGCPMRNSLGGLDLCEFALDARVNGGRMEAEPSFLRVKIVCESVPGVWVLRDNEPAFGKTPVSVLDIEALFDEPGDTEPVRAAPQKRT